MSMHVFSPTFYSQHPCVFLCKAHKASTFTYINIDMFLLHLLIYCRLSPQKTNKLRLYRIQWLFLPIDTVIIAVLVRNGVICLPHDAQFSRWKQMATDCCNKRYKRSTHPQHTYWNKKSGNLMTYMFFGSTRAELTTTSLSTPFSLQASATFASPCNAINAIRQHYVSPEKLKLYRKKKMWND